MIRSQGRDSKRSATRHRRWMRCAKIIVIGLLKNADLSRRLIKVFRVVFPSASPRENYPLWGVVGNAMGSGGEESLWRMGDEHRVGRFRAGCRATPALRTPSLTVVGPRLCSEGLKSQRKRGWGHANPDGTVLSAHGAKHGRVSELDFGHAGHGRDASLPGMRHPRRQDVGAPGLPSNLQQCGAFFWYSMAQLMRKLVISRTENIMSVKSSNNIYQLKVTLTGAKPPIWRRILVPSDIQLGKLHIVLQVVMGWENSHLHQFISGRTLYGMQYNEFSLDMEVEDENKYVYRLIYMNQPAK